DLPVGQRALPERGQLPAVAKKNARRARAPERCLAGPENVEGGLAAPFVIYPGSDLLSRAVTSAVPSALEGLTAVFGMGTGVAPPVRPPGIEIPSTRSSRPARLRRPNNRMSASVVKPHGRLVPVS